MCRTVIKTVDQCMGIHYIDAMTKWASVPINISHLSNDMKPTKFNSSRYCCADFFQSICVAMEIAPNSIQLYHQVIHNKLKTYKHTQSVEVCVCVYFTCETFHYYSNDGTVSNAEKLYYERTVHTLGNIV